MSKGAHEAGRLGMDARHPTPSPDVHDGSSPGPPSWLDSTEAVADPHILYVVLALDAVALALWVLYVLVKMPAAVPAQAAQAAQDAHAAHASVDLDRVSTAPAPEVKAPEPAEARSRLGSYSDIHDESDESDEGSPKG
jgi:hypothetical protein